MSKLKRGSDRPETTRRRPLYIAAACAVLWLMPVGAGAQQADMGSLVPLPATPEPGAQVQVQTDAPAGMGAPSLDAEDHSAHSGMADLPDLPDAATPEASGDAMSNSTIVYEPGIAPTSDMAPDMAPDAASEVAPDAAPTTALAPPGPLGQALTFLQRGGPAIWSITLLSVVALALILWKVWRLAMTGAWTGGRRAQRAVALWAEGREQDALDHLEGRRTCRAILVRTAMAARRDGTLDDVGARAETERVARGLIAAARGGLRPLELIATIAPLLGLLGTVMGMIAAFQALQEAGSRADPAILAGGIWEALLTTAAGMAVAIPASMALTWFESVVDRLRQEMEDAATRIFLRPVAQDAKHSHARAAE